MNECLMLGSAERRVNFRYWVQSALAAFARYREGVRTVSAAVAPHP